MRMSTDTEYSNFTHKYGPRIHPDQVTIEILSLTRGEQTNIGGSEVRILIGPGVLLSPEPTEPLDSHLLTSLPPSLRFDRRAHLLAMRDLVSRLK
ncbi:hypothetical protein RRG08_027488 [Elysia crispata]|uniref:Uncharacterized protein n=1 Tax=Elysia crispata TaxID=231223 RepID=A0AAE0YRG1_9GAST|nr:hypothetical protein RRG08_027488 [Elysia crispata]